MREHMPPEDDWMTILAYILMGIGFCALVWLCSPENPVFSPFL